MSPHILGNEKFSSWETLTVAVHQVSVLGPLLFTTYLLTPRSRVVPQKQWRTQDFFWGGGSTNSVEDRGQRKWGSGGGSPLVRGSTQFANE
jgi:hypothetical protein